MNKKRIPTQKRSIEKRNKIIKKGFELICKQGYYNTTTNEIASYANVSVGIIYQYFDDKKDILIEGIKNYINNILYPTTIILEKENLNNKNIKETIENIIDNFIKTHTISKNAHEEILAMTHQDKDVANIFKNAELKITDKIVTILKNNEIKTDNLEEKVHIIIGIIENFCHEVVYHKHKKLNYDNMKNEVIKIISDIITNDYKN